MNRNALYIILLIFLTNPSFAQTGGDNVYEFLNLTHSGLVAGLGGTNVSLPQDNLNLTYHNPALLRQGMNNSLALNYVNYFAGINYGLALYSHTFNGIGNFAAGLTYLNYGSFTGADASGNITESFRASEYAFQVMYSYEFDSLFTVGLNFKPVLSHLEDYTSVGFAFDIGAAYHDRSNLFSAGLVIKNAGYEVTTFAGEPREKLPFEIQAGISQRLAHSPLRLSLTIRHLEKFDLTHEYIDQSAATSDNKSSPEFIENLMRHLIFGAELIPHRNFYFCGGFNYQRRRELQVESRVATVGFSWGFGINTSFLNLEFGRSTYHLAGSSNHVSLIIRPDRIYRKAMK
jgi:hypothetical protein